MCPFGLKQESPVSRCGQLSVPANYADPGGPQFQLPYVVFSSRATPSRKATIVLQGGPGASSGEIAHRLAALFRQAQPADDVIVFDQRGAGASQPRLFCQVSPELSFTRPDALKTQVTACLDQAQFRGIHLSDLNTRASADDVALLAKTLGYEQLNLYGMSYGTRLAQEVVRRYPALVSSQVLDGVIEPDRSWFAHQTRHQYDTLVNFGAACAANHACPTGTDLPAQIQSAADVVDAAQVTYQPPVSGLAPQPITGELMLLSFQPLGYSPYALQTLPARLAALQKRNAEALARIPWDAQYTGSRINWPTYPAVICQDSQLDEATIQAAHAGLPPVFQKMATLPRTLASFCTQAGLSAPVDTLTPVTGNVPTLLLSGRFDAVTTVDVAERVARRFQPSQHVIFEAGGHVNGTASECGLQLLLTFLNSPSNTLNTSCAALPLTWGATPPVVTPTP